MKIEQHLTDLETSKKLKELGAPQKSYFYWLEDELVSQEDIEGGKEYEKMFARYFSESKKRQKKKIYSAYLLSELIELLGDKIIMLNNKEKIFGFDVYPFVSIEFTANLLIKLIEEDVLSFNNK